MFNYRTCCRLCLKDSKIVVNCTEINDLCVKIEEVFGFKISKDDDYSTKICRDCTYQVTNFAVFRESVLNNQKTIENYKNLETKIEAIKIEGSDDDVVLVTEEERTKVTSSTENENCFQRKTSFQNPVCLSTLNSRKDDKLRLKKLKVVLQQLSEKDIAGLKIKSKDQKALNPRTRRKSFANAIKILNIILSDEMKEKNQLESETNQNKTLEDISNSCSSIKNLENIENVVNNTPSHKIGNQISKTTIQQTPTTECQNKSEGTAEIQHLRNIQKAVNSNESKISDNNENPLSNLKSTHGENIPSGVKPIKSIRIKTVKTRNPQLDNFSKSQNELQNNSSPRLLSKLLTSNYESPSDSTMRPLSLNSFSTLSSSSNLTNNLCPMSLSESHQTSPNNLLTMPVLNHSRFSTGPTTSIQSQKPQTIILKTPNSTIGAITQPPYLKHLPATSTVQTHPSSSKHLPATSTLQTQSPSLKHLSGTSMVQEQPPKKICKISTLMTPPSTSSAPNALSSSYNSSVQLMFKNGVNSNNLIFIKSNTPTSMNSSVLSTTNSTNVQTLQRPSNHIHLTPLSTHNQSPISNEHNSNITLSPLSSSLSKSANNSIGDHRVKVLSVNELNSRAAISSSSHDQHQQQWTVESPNLSSQKLPIRITLSRLRDKIRIKLTDHLMSDIHFNSLTLQERVAVRKSLLQPSSRLKIMKAIQECSLDAYSEDLLNSIGLRSIFNCNAVS